MVFSCKIGQTLISHSSFPSSPGWDQHTSPSQSSISHSGYVQSKSVGPKENSAACRIKSKPFHRISRILGSLCCYFSLQKFSSMFPEVFTAVCSGFFSALLECVWEAEKMNMLQCWVIKILCTSISPIRQRNFHSYSTASSQHCPKNACTFFCSYFLI